MKKIALLSIGVAFILQNASAQLVNSFENSVEGWGTLGANWTSGGFSTTTGVTQGTWSWILNAAASPDYSGAIGGTATTALTAELANAASVSIDVFATGFSFQQWDLDLNSSAFTVPLGGSYQSVDGFNFPQSPVIGTETTLTWVIPTSMRALLAADPTAATSLNFQIGGGAAGTMEIDNLRITPVPEPTTMALFGLGALGLLKFARRRNS